jgi:hypothetical protein
MGRGYEDPASGRAGGRKVYRSYSGKGRVNSGPAVVSLTFSFDSEIGKIDS